MDGWLTCSSGSERRMDLQILIMNTFYFFLRPDSRNEKHPLNHGRPNVLWQRATPVIVGWFAGRSIK
jgi:hypothetical protein